jgi:hypothetical protein
MSNNNTSLNKMVSAEMTSGDMEKQIVSSSTALIKVPVQNNVHRNRHKKSGELSDRRGMERKEQQN